MNGGLMFFGVLFIFCGIYSIKYGFDWFSGKMTGAKHKENTRSRSMIIIKPKELDKHKKRAGIVCIICGIIFIVAAIFAFSYAFK